MNEITSNTAKLLALKMLHGIGDAALSNLYALSEFSSMSVHDIAFSNFSKNNSYTADDIDSAIHKAETQIEFSIKNGGNIISFFDDIYPNSLRATRNLPPILFCKGNMDCLSEKNITVIGTREPTEHGKIISYNLTEWFTLQGWNVVSGLAVGIDAIAHTACIESTGKTIAVLAHGLEKIYPIKNKNLADRILDNNGLLVSEYTYYSNTYKTNFVKRDTTQAALSSAVFLVQTDTVGGSLHASRSALLLGRPLVVVGQSKTDIENKEPKCNGNLILAQGNRQDVLKLLKINSYDQKLLLNLPNKSQYSIVNDIIEQFTFNDIKNKNLSFGF